MLDKNAVNIVFGSLLKRNWRKGVVNEEKIASVFCFSFLFVLTREDWMDARALGMLSKGLFHACWCSWFVGFSVVCLPPIRSRKDEVKASDLWTHSMFFMSRLKTAFVIQRRWEEGGSMGWRRVAEEVDYYWRRDPKFQIEEIDGTFFWVEEEDGGWVILM